MYQNHDKKEVWKIRALMAVWTVIVFFWNQCAFWLHGVR